jgi:hypothetical protein
MPRPQGFKAGEDCDDCVYFSRGYCKKWHWVVKPEDWCKSYKATPAHLAAFKHKEGREKEEGKL